MSNAPVLYKSWSGWDVKEFSYTLAKDIAFCGAYTRLTRFQGIGPKLYSAAMKFGICVEESFREHMQADADLVKGFAVKWKDYEKTPLKYGKNDRDWWNLSIIGKELMQEIGRQERNLPTITDFSIEFPADQQATWYKGTRLKYIADAVSLGDDPILIDIKTAGRSYAEGENHSAVTYGYPALDPQLRVGALASGIRNVGFLVFVKGRNPHVEFHTGYVTDQMLEDVDIWLREQYDKLVERRLPMVTGVRWPNDQCLNCDMLPKCLGREDIAAKTLMQKESKGIDELIASLDA